MLRILKQYDCFIECTEEEFEKTLRKFHCFKDNHILFDNKSKKSENQHTVVNMKTTTRKNKDDSVKRGAVRWGKYLFLEQKTPKG